MAGKAIHGGQQGFVALALGEDNFSQPAAQFALRVQIQAVQGILRGFKTQLIQGLVRRKAAPQPPGSEYA